MVTVKPILSAWEVSSCAKASMPPPPVPPSLLPLGVTQHTHFYKMTSGSVTTLISVTPLKYVIWLWGDVAGRPLVEDTAALHTVIGSCHFTL